MWFWQWADTNNNRADDIRSGIQKAYPIGMPFLRSDELIPSKGLSGPETQLGVGLGRDQRHWIKVIRGQQPRGLPMTGVQATMTAIFMHDGKITTTNVTHTGILIFDIMHRSPPFYVDMKRLISLYPEFIGIPRENHQNIVRTL